MSDYRITIASRSMEPTLAIGSVVAVARVSPEIGDVAAFMSGTQVMVHRIIARWETVLGVYYVHCGDAGSRWGLFRENEFIGVVKDSPRRNPGALTAHWLWFLSRVALAYAEHKRRRGRHGRNNLPPTAPLSRQ